MHKLLFIVLLVGGTGSRAEDWDVMPQGDIAGPVVKTSATTTPKHHAADHIAAGVVPADGAAGTDVTDKDAGASKKTIAQMLDEALEQEFPKEAEAAQGKNYNETAKKEDV